MKIHVADETSRLKAVILGTALSNGPTPSAEEAYDPKSLEHILAGTYPVEEDMVKEMDAFKTVLEKYDVTVYRPRIINDCNQIFTRDIAMVIEDKLIKSNILPDREDEKKAIEYIIEKIPSGQVIQPPEEVHIEGGDVMLWKDHIFIGTYKGDDYPDQITARTNMQAVRFIKELFPHKTVREFDLVKSKTEARDNALHLDCCFQPVGDNLGIIYEGGFRDVKDYEYLRDLFGKENLFHITRDEMYQMFSNVFSIAPDVVVSERNFKRLNDWLRLQGLTVEEIPYAEIAKQEGLLRCSTMPLLRA
ncbi:dimethylarginine dimethylaminohydrolase family protein [Robertkochia aurantiaca]|uniref:dimethylarginine dimethylaminohydrolase family protein n=1 Tax=Robertkochia aurantiaca TaxID=2873700 RepID=UPI001CC9B91F|nr:arginine deiminase family protein [Robertkochia sp. 3YJGBD-33]